MFASSFKFSTADLLRRAPKGTSCAVLTESGCRRDLIPPGCQPLLQSRCGVQRPYHHPGAATGGWASAAPTPVFRGGSGWEHPGSE